MSTPVPPPLAPRPPQKKQTIRTIILLLLACVCALLLVTLLGLVSMGRSFSAWMNEATELHYKSYTDKFQVTVLEVKSGPDFLTERIRVRCEGDMIASIWLTDLKQAGMFQTNGPAHQTVYREGQPHKAGSSAPVHAEGKFSTCEILFRVKTTSTSTLWHDEVAGSSLDTTLATPLVISEVQTNWPGPYERGSELPLASLGEYKILLSAK